ncbi:MAG TPA: hypothetical protein PK156_28700, partial [Polyangium sp.]|nr:hypothetical protein [Polyangium sp.]
MASPNPSEKNVDILVITALQDELDGILSIGPDWQEHRDLAGFRYYRRDVTTSRGTSFSVAAAWIGEMGQRSASIRGAQLEAELGPSCLAMCGICAGYRSKVGLGDIIVADRLFAYDEGKLQVSPSGESTFAYSMRAFDLDAVWKVDASYLAREIDIAPLQAERPPTKDAQRKWLLRTLHAHETEGKPAPMQHPDRAKLCPEWTPRLTELLENGFVMRTGAKLALTEKGRDAVFEDLLLHPDGLPAEPPLQVHVGTVATGSAVVEDAGIFERLRKVQRTTIGLEMEGTALGELAARGGKQSILVKAVVDYADPDKDDGFRRFACRASAWFLFAFLEKHFEPRQQQKRFERREFDFDREREHPFLVKVERAAQARFPTAKITKHPVEPPFVGLLQLEIETHGLFDTRLVAALDQSITPELVQQFALLERPFRDDFPPLRSTIVHRGDAAPSELSRQAWRKSIQLETFYAYQALFDLTKYLEWQTARLQADPIYPPAMYVDPPAT